MITGDLKSKIDRIWDAFWSGGIAPRGPDLLFTSARLTDLIVILDDVKTRASAS